MNFTTVELANMHFCYGQANGNGREAQRIYQDKYPNLTLPHHTKFQKIHQQLLETGSLSSKTPSSANNCIRPLHHSEQREDVLEAIDNDPNTSTRKIAEEVGTSHVSVWRILKREGLYSYHHTKVQELNPSDYPNRVTFCRWLLEKIETRPEFLRNIIFTDESTFSRDGTFNSANEHT